MRKFNFSLQAIFVALIIILGLSESCKKEPSSCFNFTSESVANNEDIQTDEEITFTNCSENAEMYLWDFGDDNSSSEANPVHSYSDQGSYAVKLTAYGKDNSEEDFTLKTINIICPTILTVTVITYETNDLVPNCEVYIFESEQDYENFENYIFGYTDQNGQIVFDEGIKSIQYIIFAGYLVDDTHAFLGAIQTDVLKKAKNNELMNK